MKKICSITLCFLALSFGSALAGDAVCPISGKAVDASVTSNVNGKSVGFCCEKCQSKFEKSLDLTDSGPGECPVSGEQAGADTRLILAKTEAVSFCCGKCQKKYAADHKVTAVKDEGPKKCAYSGKEADPESFVVHNGKKVYFCCDKCVAKFSKENHVLMTKTNPDKCAVSGEAADKDYVSFVTTAKAVYFCCEKCQGKYVKEQVAAKL